MRAIVLTNPKAGVRTDEAQALRAALQRAGIDADVRERPGSELARAALEASAESPDAIIAAGGDGTVSAVAGALVDSAIPLAVLPTGTLNHFAKDLGIPIALDAAAKAIASSTPRLIDIGEVNERFFVNNSSIGLYPRIVGKRDRVRQRLGRGKWIAMLLAFISVFRRYPTVRVRIGVKDETVLRTTPFVFIGNNRYEMNLTMLGRRQRIDGGELCVYFPNRTGRLGLLRLAILAVIGRLEQSRDFDVLNVTELWIETPKRTLAVALDGEVVRLSPPLHYRIRPRALKVLAPAMSGSA